MDCQERLFSHSLLRLLQPQQLFDNYSTGAFSKVKGSRIPYYAHGILRALVATQSVASVVTKLQGDPATSIDEEKISADLQRDLPKMALNCTVVHA
jgi:hypothetical protein